MKIFEENLKIFHYFKRSVKSPTILSGLNIKVFCRKVLCNRKLERRFSRDLKKKTANVKRCKIRGAKKFEQSKKCSKWVLGQKRPTLRGFEKFIEICKDEKKVSCPPSHLGENFFVHPDRQITIFYYFSYSHVIYSSCITVLKK